jgi:branched-subunit amino acid ABC-type transport system permease component
MSHFLEYAVRGLPYGCVFALLAVGLVLNYKTSGVFNLAFAAQAYVSAAVFYVLRFTHQWPLAPAAIVAVVIVGPLLGLILDRALYRHLRTATPLAKLVTSLGLLVAIPELTKLLLGFGNEPQYNPPPLWPAKRTDDFYWPPNTFIRLDAGQIVTIAATVLVLGGLWWLFQRSSLGLQMRASVESPRLVELQGIDADRSSTVGWMLSSFIAGLCGVLLAPLFAALVSNDLFTLLVGALAATVFAGLTSIPRAAIGGIVLGILGAELAGLLPTNSILATAMRPSLPFIVLFGLLVGRLAWSKIRGRDVQFEKEVSDPLAGVDPPPPVPAALLRPRWMTIGTRAFGAVVTVVLFLLCWFVFDQEWLAIFVGGTCLAVVLLSMVMMTGIGGTISLCQATFAAIGAFTTAQLVSRTGMGVLVAMLLGGLVAAAVGAVLAFPVIRLPGIYAALATLAFALMFEQIMVPQKWLSGGSLPVEVPRPQLGSINFSDDRYFLVLAAILLAICSVGVILVRRGTTGRFLDAVRGSEVGAASIGISPSRQRWVSFILAAGIAGFGGGLLASFDGQANYNNRFVFLFGIVWLTLVVTAGARSVQSAITGGIGFLLIPKLLEMLFAFPGNWLASHPDAGGVVRWLAQIPDPSWALGVAFVLFGLGALTYAKHPEGIIEFQTTRSLQRILDRVDRYKQKHGSGTPPEVTDADEKADEYSAA